MPNVYFAGFFAVMLLLGFGGSYLKGRSDGSATARAEYSARDLKAAQDYATKEREIAEANREKESAWAQQNAETSKKYQWELANAHTQRLADLAALDNRTLRLRDPNADHQACGDPAAPAATSPPGHHGGEGAYIPSKTAAFLLGLVTEADTVVRQLTACQQILGDERK